MLLCSLFSAASVFYILQGEKKVSRLYDLPVCWRESTSCLGRDLGLDSCWHSPLASNAYPEDGALKTNTNPVIMLLSSQAYVISSTFWLFPWPKTIAVSRWRHQENECRIEFKTSHLTMEPSAFVGRRGRDCEAAVGIIRVFCHMVHPPRGREVYNMQSNVI